MHFHLLLFTCQACILCVVTLGLVNKLNDKKSNYIKNTNIPTLNACYSVQRMVSFVLFVK